MAEARAALVANMNKGLRALRVSLDWPPLAGVEEVPELNHDKDLHWLASAKAMFEYQKLSDGLANRTSYDQRSSRIAITRCLRVSGIS
jgi:hypothetical protein